MTIDRLPYGSLNYSTFLQRYANSSRPVIFTFFAHLLLPEGEGGGSTEA
jgi:hypothetical protein